MATGNLTPADRVRFARARQRGRTNSRNAAAIISAQYDDTRAAIDLKFRGGGAMLIPVELIPGLERAAASDLQVLSVSPAGDALFWPSLDLHVFVPGLVERAFGMRLLA